MRGPVFAVLLLFGVSGFADPEVIPRSKSPDKQFQVSVEQINEHIDYRIESVADGKILLRIASSYLPEKGSEVWAYKQSLNAEIHWRKDSRAVAIDEANHRRMGTVLFARQRGLTFSQIPLSVRDLMKLTGEPWDRGRLFFGEWRNMDTAVVALGGRLYDPKENRYEDSGWKFEIDLVHSGRVKEKRKLQ